MVQLVCGEFSAKCVAVNAEEVRGAGLIAVNAVQHALDEAFFELSDSLIEENPAFHHLAD